MISFHYYFRARIKNDKKIEIAADKLFFKKNKLFRRYEKDLIEIISTQKTINPKPMQKSVVQQLSHHFLQ
jgi:hypothetical protein